MARVGPIDRTSAVSSSWASGPMKLSMKSAVAPAVFDTTPREITLGSQ